MWTGGMEQSDVVRLKVEEMSENLGRNTAAEKHATDTVTDPSNQGSQPAKGQDMANAFDSTNISDTTFNMTRGNSDHYAVTDNSSVVNVADKVVYVYNYYARKVGLT